MLNDLRFAFRQLRKSPGFTFVAILTLALCIGANCSIFSVINAVLLRPLPYPDPDRLVILTESDADQPAISVSYPDYLDWKKENTVFETLAVARRESLNLSGLQGHEPEQISGAVVTADFFQVIGLKPQIGRVFTEQEDRAGGPALAVISDQLWHQLFQRDPAVLGRVLNFGGELYTVIGVMPPQMFSPRKAEVWFPLRRHAVGPGWTMRENHPGLFAWGRLKPGISVETARAQMKTIAANLEKAYPKSNYHVGTTVAPLLENQVGQYRASLTLLFVAVGVVLLIACVNLANLLAARGAARSREFALRAAVGASRWQIVRQLLVESLLLGLAGGAVGLFLAAWSRDLILALAPAGDLRFQSTRLDAAVLGFSLVASLGTSLLFGLWPAIHTSRADLQLALKSGDRGTSDSRAARRSRDFLFIAEVALTLVLLTATGLVLKSFANARSVGLGFQPNELLTASIDLPDATYPDSKKIIPFTDALIEKLKTLPGVSHSAVATNPPLMTGWQTGFYAEGRPEPPPGQMPSAEMTVVSNDYLQTIEAPLLRGRMFDAHDRFNGAQVAIVDQLLAEKYFPNENPIGKRLKMFVDQERGREWRTIVGVVPHLKVYGFEEEVSLPQVLLPLAQSPQTNLTVLLRSSLPPQALEEPLHKIVASIDPTQPVYDFRTMQQRVEETWTTARLLTFLLSIFAGLASILAVVGIYGVISYNGLRRVREIGVRLALGARRGQIVGLILGQGIRLLAIGLAIGFAVAFALARVMRSLLFGVSATDPLIFFAGSVLLGCATVVACWIPAHRASRVDPIITLRAE
ncbi:MAG TPA: ABC transporter permease [Chthoniobacterales bacterium]